jgi:hypothetical protein
MEYSFAGSEAESTPRVGQGHAGQVQELSPRAAAGDHRDVVAAYPEGLRDEADECLIGATFYRRSRETYPQPPVGDAGEFAPPRPRRDPDGEAQAAARFGERPDVTT